MCFVNTKRIESEATMKRITAVILALVILFSAALPCSAMSISEGVDQLRTLWSRNNGPMVNGHDIDYSYYSPVANGKSADQKYPLVVIMAGALEGIVEGFELTANALASWTADEYQSRFHNGAAFLLIGRAPEEEEFYWDSSVITPSFMAAIDDFVKNNPCVDTSRIYSVGWCLGGVGSLNLLTMYPDYFAAGMVMTPSREITPGEAQILKDKPIWVAGCKRDSYISYRRVILRSWNNLKKATNHPENIRFTSYDRAPGVTLADTFPFINDHDVWTNVAYDRASGNEAYVGEKTVDGNETVIDSPTVIAWLNSFTLDEDADTSGQLPSRFYKFFNETLQNEVRVFIIKVILRFLATFGYIALY